MSVLRRVFIVGITGQVGGALREALQDGTEARVVEGSASSPEAAGGMAHIFDLEEVAQRPAAFAECLERFQPDVVINAAGMTYVDGCEQQETRAMRINGEAAGQIAAAAARVGARVVYFSTEYVFDGTSGPYTETDVTCPLSVYGKSKLLGEQLVAAADGRSLILRTTVVFGPEARGKNFAYQLAARLGSGQKMVVPSDQVSSPTYNRDLARASLALLERGASGIWNVAGPEVMDRVEFARRLARTINADASLIEGRQTKELSQAAPRPLQAGLLIGKLRQLLADGCRMRTVEEAVADWLRHGKGRAWP